MLDLSAVNMFLLSVARCSEKVIEMQAEGSFGSCQFVVGCFASGVEFGPQRFADDKTTRPA
jgi:hypothetical protein